MEIKVPGVQLLRKRKDRGDPISAVIERLISTEPRNPLGTRKHLGTDQSDPMSILKKRHGLNNLSLETMKQNWNCQ